MPIHEEVRAIMQDDCERWQGSGREGYTAAGKRRWKGNRLEPYSNCKAATLDGNPETTQVISHGRRCCRAVLTAPPLDKPLCWSSRRRGFGVDPTYRAECRTVDRSR